MPKNSRPGRSRKRTAEPKPPGMDQRNLTALDQAIDAVLGGRAPAGENLDARLRPLLGIARDLIDLPRAEFKARLKSELERKTAMPASAEAPAASQQTITANLRVNNAEAAIEFYKQAFGAREIMRFNAGGRVAHAELRIGNSRVDLAEQSPEYGFYSPQVLGGSPVQMEIWVPDVDSAAAQAVAAGARVVSPIANQFYGARSGQFADPFGYTWTIATLQEELTVEEMYRRFEILMRGGKVAGVEDLPKPGVNPTRPGFHTITPYLIAPDVPELVEFLKQTFGAEELSRNVGSAGGFHSEVRVGDSMLMIGGGGPGVAWRGAAEPAAFHVYVEDTDATYRRALDAGAESIQPPVDQPYGERGGGVKDRAGNHWYIATHMGASYVPEGLRTVNPYLHPLRADPVLTFLEKAFGAGDVQRYASPQGVVMHARIRVGDSVLEMGEAHGPYQAMSSRFYMYVPDVDAMYRRALEAGAVSMAEPSDQPYGDRLASVKDAFGNQWHIATHIGPAEG